MILLELFAGWRRVPDAQPDSEINSSRALFNSSARERQLHTRNPPFTQSIKLFKRADGGVAGDPGER